MQYAVIKAGGKQYRVSAGDTLEVDKLNFAGKKSITFNEVMLSVNEGAIVVGKPFVDGASVEASLIEEKKGEKIRVTKFKAKSRYRRVMGFRAQHSVIKIDKIDFGGKKADKPTKSAPKSEKE